MRGDARRPVTRGKFLYVGDEKFWVRGVTYGTFRPGPDGAEYVRRERVESDLAEIAGNGFNAIRTYTVPPRWLLDAALGHGLRVMVGLPWEQHVTFLDDGARAWSIERRVRAGVRACAGHPAVLWYAIGNEIPSPIVRWHGPRRVERYLRRLHEAVKSEDPDALVTYVNYPSTEYLELPFLDVVAVNVYLETRERLAAYLARLQNLAGDRPLVMAEVGFDSRRHGLRAQAEVLEWQVRTTFAAGAAGLFVFAWTDEWHRGGHDVEDWDFGLTRRDRRPKPALTAVSRALAEVPFPKDLSWPRISVVVCSYNGARTIRECLEGLLRLDYPNFEVIVVDDGSTDATPAIAREYGFRVISTPNRGLSHARNLGWRAAAGEIVAYLDDDAFPDPHWLRYVAAAFLSSGHAAIGGPNIPPGTDGLVGECVANAPGGPQHVLLTDTEAEHIPGCNMAIRRRALEAIGGFDPQFRAAGDDVDVCWRLRQQGWTIGFSPGAVVWHHRRASVRAYWKQQVGYGRAEALLERKWPEKYNGAGHLAWGGRLYGPGWPGAPWRARRIGYGRWGAALFQSVYQDGPGTLEALPLMPEWYLVVLGLAALSALGAWWPPLRAALPLLGAALAATLVQATLGAARAIAGRDDCRSRRERLRLRAVTALLYVLQPLARLRGRLERGLTPWRRRGPPRAWSVPRRRTFAVWREAWQAPDASLDTLQGALRDAGAAVRAGGDLDRWDLEIRVGALAAVRLRMVNEEHGAGRQLLRYRTWPRPSAPWGVAALGLVAAGIASQDWIVGPLLGGLGLALVLRALLDASGAMELVRLAVPATGVVRDRPVRWEREVEQAA